MTRRAEEDGRRAATTVATGALRTSSLLPLPHPVPTPATRRSNYQERGVTGRRGRSGWEGRVGSGRGEAWTFLADAPAARAAKAGWPRGWVACQPGPLPAVPPAPPGGRCSVGCGGRTRGCISARQSSMLRRPFRIRKGCYGRGPRLQDHCAFQAAGATGTRRVLSNRRRSTRDRTALRKARNQEPPHHLDRLRFPRRHAPFVPLSVLATAGGRAVVLDGFGEDARGQGHLATGGWSQEGYVSGFTGELPPVHPGDCAAPWRQ